MTELKSIEPVRALRHEFRQPLNVLRLTTENLRSRLSAMLDESSAAYLLSKLARIDKQTDRLAQLVDRIGDPIE